jgi:hypothetical protein
LLLVGSTAICDEPKSSRQPKVAPGPREPDWVVLLKDRYGLAMFDDLVNPVKTTVEATPGLFRKAGPGPVRFAPEIALGLETRNRGGWYKPLTPFDKKRPTQFALWSYVCKNTTDDVRTGRNVPPPLDAKAELEFDPGDAPFGLWVSNDGLQDGGVFSEPAMVARVNQRLAKQPYKAMIYPYRDRSTGKLVPHSFLIGWEYSTNDDFQDVVCRIDNVILLPATAHAGAAK